MSLEGSTAMFVLLIGDSGPRRTKVGAVLVCVWTLFGLTGVLILVSVFESPNRGSVSQFERPPK